MEREINTLIMKAILDIISLEFGEPVDDDPTSLRLIELPPRDENFDRAKLSCVIYPNDPDNPGTWVSEDTNKWLQRSMPFGAADKYNIMEGGQAFIMRFTLKFELLYQRDKLPKETVLNAANVIMSRIHRALLDDHKRNKKLVGLSDDFGAYVIKSTRAVKKKELHIRGGSKTPFASGKMYLEVEVYYDI